MVSPQAPVRTLDTGVQNPERRHLRGTPRSTQPNGADVSAEEVQRLLRAITRSEQFAIA